MAVNLTKSIIQSTVNFWDIYPQENLADGIYCIDLDDVTMAQIPCLIMNRNRKDYFINKFPESTKEIKTSIYETAESHYYNTAKYLVDAKIPEYIDIVKMHNIVVGLTSRRHMFAEVTEAQLSKLKVRFTVDMEDGILFDQDTYGRNGVLYTNFKHKAKAIYYYIQHRLKIFPDKKIKTVVVIDDNKVFLDGIESLLLEKLNQLGIILKLYWYQKIEKETIVYPEEYAKKIMDIQCRELLRNSIMFDHGAIAELEQAEEVHR